MSRNVLAHLSLLGANLIYGANYSIAKLVMPDYIKPFGFVLLRCLGAVLLFWLVRFIVNEEIERKDLPKLVLCALFGIAINQLLFLKGLALTHPINASILMTATPILVLVMAAIIIRERVTKRKMLGVVLGMAGALMVITSGKTISFDSETFVGDMLIFINAASYGVFLVLVSPFMAKYNPLTVMRWVFSLGLIMVVPFGWQELGEVQWHTFPGHIWASTVFVVVGLSFFAYLFNSIGLRYLSPSVVSIYIYLQPILASLIAVGLGTDSLTWLKVISTALIFSGVWLVSGGISMKKPIVAR